MRSLLAPCMRHCVRCSDHLTAVYKLLIYKLPGPEAETMAAARQLLAAGFHVGAIRPPTVPAGTCRLRVSLSAAHTFADIDDLADAILGCRLRFAAPLAHLLLPPPWSREWLTAQDAADTAAAAGPGGAGRLAAMLPRARM